MLPQLGVSALQGLCASMPGLLLLDVREPWEAALTRLEIDGAGYCLMPMGEVTGRFAELEPSQPIVVYCHHGMRSLQVVAFLQRQGFDSVYNLAGGIDAWSREVDPAVPRY